MPLSCWNVTIVGMGALGLLFGERIKDDLGTDHLVFLLDRRRKERHTGDRYIINGKPVSFRMEVPDEITRAADRIITAGAGGVIAWNTLTENSL